MPTCSSFSRKLRLFLGRSWLTLAVFALGLLAGQGLSGAEGLSFLTPKPATEVMTGQPIPLRIALAPKLATQVSSLRYYNGPSLIAEVVAPYRFTWTTAPRGKHLLRAVTTTDQGQELVATVEVAVEDPTTPVDLASQVDASNVTFTTLGVNARDSMPLGNGDISLNAWTYANGDVGLLIGKLDAYSGESNADGVYSLRKIGRVRISLDPPLFKQAADNGTFKQTLVLGDGAIRFTGQGTEMTVWVDRNHSIVRTELQGTTSTVMTVQNDTWRTEDVAGVHRADVIFPGLTDQIAWCYHDPRTDVGFRNIHEKGLVGMAGVEGAGMVPHITTVSFGALIEGPGLRSINAKTLRSEPAATQRADINVLRYSRQREATPERWLSLVQQQVATSRTLPISQAWADHRRWWKGYWDRGYLRITSGMQHEEVTSQFLHLRFMNACQTGPMKELWRVPFNGGTFNVDCLDVDMGKGMGATFKKPELPMTADYRMWGASDRVQNIRHVYWPMLMTGDFELGRAWYLWPTVASKHWQKTVEENTGLKDAFMSVGCSGWEGLNKRFFGQRSEQVASRIVPEGIGDNPRRYTFDAADEYLPYMIDYYELTGDEDFLIHGLVPYAAGLFRFFDQYFTRDAAGKLVIWPCMTSEAYVKFPDNGFVPANPMGGVALLRSQLPRLLALKGHPGISSDLIGLWQRVYDATPEYPRGMRRNGKLGLAPHEPDWDIEQKKSQGHDRSTLYAIWPYRGFMFPAAGTSPADYELATNTLALDDNGSRSWQYGDYCAAILGLADRARKGVLTRINSTEGTSTSGEPGFFRFPSFRYVRSPDWMPNVEGGNVVLSTLNYMLWNWKGDTIYVCPAWPKDWDCEFKFRGPKQTLVQGRVQAGQVFLDRVVPESRRKDIIICAPQ